MRLAVVILAVFMVGITAVAIKIASHDLAKIEQSRNVEQDSSAGVPPAAGQLPAKRVDQLPESEFGRMALRPANGLDEIAAGQTNPQPSAPSDEIAGEQTEPQPADGLGEIAIEQIEPQPEDGSDEIAGEPTEAQPADGIGEIAIEQAEPQPADGAGEIAIERAAPRQAEGLRNIGIEQGEPQQTDDSKKIGMERIEPRQPLSELGLALPPKPVASASTEPSSDLPGIVLFRPVAISSARFQVMDHVVAVAGVDDVTHEERCVYEGQEWECGVYARMAVRTLTRVSAITCFLSPSAPKEASAECRVDTQDVGRWLVGRGLARAEPGSRYSELEKKAREAKIGIFGPPPLSKVNSNQTQP